MRPLIIEPSMLVPLPQNEWEAMCENCDKKRARWEFFPVELNTKENSHSVFICSLCWLYESEWGKNRKKEVAKFVREVGAHRNKAFVMSKGRLLVIQDANEILGSIALTSRMFQMHARSEL